MALDSRTGEEEEILDQRVTDGVASGQDHPPLHHPERISLVRNRMREFCSSGSVGGEGGNRLAYPATYTAMLREKAQAASTARPKVPMRRLGAHCLVVVMKRGNARGAKGAGHQRWIRSTGNGRNPIINGRRQPSLGDTSRMMREYHVRICEGLGVKFPGSTRQGLPLHHVGITSGVPQTAADLRGAPMSSAI